MKTKATQMFQMLHDKTVELTVNGVSLGRAKVIAYSLRSIETSPPIEQVRGTFQFVDEEPSSSEMGQDRPADL